MAFNVTECEKFINMVSDSTLQLTFRKLSVVVLVLYQRKISTIMERTIKTLYLLYLQVCVTPDFLQMLQPK